MKVLSSSHLDMPAHMLQSRTFSPALAIYLDLAGTISISQATHTISITTNSTTYSFPYVGLTLAELAREISSASGFIHCNPLAESGPLNGGFLYIDSVEDLTVDGAQIVRMRGFNVRYIEETQIRALPPYSESRLLPWYPLIDRGSISVSKDGVRYLFSVPDYYSQEWSTTFGRPFVDQLGVKTDFIDSKTIRVPRTPIFWFRNNLGLRVNNAPTGASLIQDVDIHNGLIKLKVPVDKGDAIFADYTYREDRLIYKGININPSVEHNPAIVDQTVLIYLVPTISSTGQERTATVNHIVAKTLSGALASIPQTSEPTLVVGAFQVRPSGVINDLSVTDTRTRGGGIKPEYYERALKYNREVFSTADTGRWDGVPFPGAATGILRLPKSILDTYDADFVETMVQRHLAVGGSLLIDYVDDPLATFDHFYFNPEFFI
jgi:hypothetical protein